MKFTRTVKITQVRRTVTVPARCPHCGKALPAGTGEPAPDPPGPVGEKPKPKSVAKVLPAVLALAILPAAFGQDLSFTQSGPFWEHRIQSSNLSSNCTLTVNGTPLPNGPAIIRVSTPMATIKVSMKCMDTSYGFGNFDGQVQVNATDETPTIVGSGFLPPLLHPMTTGVSFTGTYTGTVHTNIGTQYHLNLRVSHGTSRDATGAYAACYNNLPAINNLASGSAAPINITGSCDNNYIQIDYGPPHDFGDPNSGQGAFGYFVTNLGIFSGLGPSGVGGASIGDFSLYIQSAYKVAPPKIALDQTKLTLKAMVGSKTTVSSPLAISNAAGGLLQWKSRYAGFTDPAGGSISLATDPAQGDPNQMTGIDIHGSTAVQVTATSFLSFPNIGTFSGTLTIFSQNATNGSPGITIPVDVVVEGQQSDLSDQDTVTSPTCSIPPSGNSKSSPRAATTYADHITAIAGDTKPGQMTVTLGCVPNLGPANCNVNVNIAYRTLTGGPNWFSVAPTSGTITYSNTLNVTLSADPSGFATPGSYTAEITITGNFRSSPVTRDVIFDVLPPCTPPFVKLDLIEPDINGLLTGPSPQLSYFVDFSAGTHASASVLVRVLAGGNKLFETSAQGVTPASRAPLLFSSSAKDFTIPDDATSVSFVPVLRDASTGEEIVGDPVTVFVFPAFKVSLTLLDPQSGIAVDKPYLVKTDTSTITIPWTVAAVYTSGTPAVLGFRADAEPLGPGKSAAPATDQEIDLPSPYYLDTFLLDNKDSVDFRAALANRLGQDKQSDPENVEIEHIDIVPDTVKPNPFSPLTVGSSPTFTFDVKGNVVRGPANLEVAIRFFSAGAVTGPPGGQIIVGTGRVLYNPPLPPIAVLSAGSFKQTVTIPLPQPIDLDWYSARIDVWIQPAEADDSTRLASASLAYSNIVTHLTIGKGPGQTPKGGPIDAKTFINNLARDLAIQLLDKEDIAAIVSNKIANFLAKARVEPTGAQIAAGAFVSLARTWNFDPPIPNDGSFEADLTFYYDPALFPDDPNFQEQKMQVIAFDPDTGMYSTYPTTIDTIAKSATFHTTNLAPWYTLGVPGPFAKISADVPFGAGAAFAVVNTGSAAANLTATAFDPQGSPAVGNGLTNPVTAPIPPKQQIVSLQVAGLAATGAAGRLQLRADQSVTGATIYSAANGNETLAFTPAAAFSALAGIESNARIDSRIGIANSSSFPAQLTLQLRDNTGAFVDQYTHQLAPKGLLTGSVTTLFPNLQQPFQGYVVVESTQAVTAIRVTAAQNAVAAFNATPVPQSPGPVGTLYAPHFTATSGATFTQLRLLNLSGTDANITIKVFAEDGTPIGSPQGITVKNGQQWWQDLATALALDPTRNFTGWLEVQGAPTGMSGEILFGDALANQFLASLPLQTTAQTSLILPFAANDGAMFTSAVAVANANATAAHAAVKAFGPDGSPAGMAALTVPPNGRVSGNLSDLIPAAAGLSVGYVTVDADQPITAFAQINPVGGGDFASVTGQPVPGSLPVPAPGLAVSPASLNFGQVTVGQPKDMNVTVTNPGTAPLAVSLSITGTGFGLPSVTLPMVPPATSITMAVRFTPPAATNYSGTLTITGNNSSPAQATVALSGSGIAAVAPPAVSVTPATLDFGNVTTGQTKDLTVTIANTGGGTLTLQTLTAPGAPFTLVQPPATPANVPPAGLPVTIRFAPTATGPQTAKLTLTTNDPVNGTSTVNLTGTGVAPVTTVQTIVIGVDDGSFETLGGFPPGASTAWFVNRLTPSAYPATLRSVQIGFVSDPSTLQPGAAINIVAAANPSGGPGINGITLTSTPAKVMTAGQFNIYNVTPLTIQSGDFVVGFSVSTTNPTATFPAALDTSSGSKLRSYLSQDGVSFLLFDTFFPGGGNLGIRAVVDVPAK